MRYRNTNSNRLLGLVVFIVAAAFFVVVQACSPRDETQLATGEFSGRGTVQLECGESTTVDMVGNARLDITVTEEFRGLDEHGDREWQMRRRVCEPLEAMVRNQALADCRDPEELVTCRRPESGSGSGSGLDSHSDDPPGVPDDCSLQVEKQACAITENSFNCEIRCNWKKGDDGRWATTVCTVEVDASATAEGSVTYICGSGNCGPVS